MKARQYFFSSSISILNLSKSMPLVIVSCTAGTLYSLHFYLFVFIFSPFCRVKHMLLIYFVI